MKKIYITQIRSAIGILPQHKATLIGLGLRYIGHTVKRKDSIAIRGMIKKIIHLIQIKEEK
ncbi:50S ribosomal protein L30 [Candidatus Tachikawaea gelatinosa]|uniref:Large ribosomal subunit protein uL30 n=1 Tax=Candidatus Tachikawaea gelatinosa TaxID=1410383 RepID=A0A090APY3_9ENTR|nr:50S ribosomal protein L30 [Candidatus Tachikawaea gelatinosa]BAP58357.1 50S ribosomal protein L30 [Candidatus Tachikawaea gelatinosa]